MTAGGARRLAEAPEHIRVAILEFEEAVRRVAASDPSGDSIGEVRGRYAVAGLRVAARLLHELADEEEAA